MEVEQLGSQIASQTQALIKSEADVQVALALPDLHPGGHLLHVGGLLQLRVHELHAVCAELERVGLTLQVDHQLPIRVENGGRIIQALFDIGRNLND